MIEREVQVADGTWYLTRIAPYRTTEDRIAGVVATFIDITRRKEAEEALRRSEARLRSAIEIETIGVILLLARWPHHGNERGVFENERLHA